MEVEATEQYGEPEKRRILNGKWYMITYTRPVCKRYLHPSSSSVVGGRSVNCVDHPSLWHYALSQRLVVFAQ